MIGPLLGGLFTDHLSWRWCFYINLPLGVIVIAMAARTIPKIGRTAKPVIDVMGIAAVSLAAGGLTLALSLGGTQFDWLSATTLGLIAASVIGLLWFIWAERRAEEPMLPLRLFTDPVFTVSVILSFVVGFAMLGAMTFLPTFLQYVQGLSATASGIHLLPMVVGMLGASVLAGNSVSRTGKYKRYPIAGAAFMALGLFLMSTMDQSTNFVMISLYMIVLGIGLGLSMQILVIIVQNTADYRDLGVATSGVSFFRSLGSTFGAASFGAIYSNALEHNLPPALAQAPSVPSEAATSPAALHSYPDGVIAPIVSAYADTLSTVFLLATPVALIALVIAFFLKEVPLREMAKAGATGVGEGFGMAESGDAGVTLETAIARLMVRDRGRAMPEIRAASGTQLNAANGWCVAQVHLRRRHHMPTDMDSIAQGTSVPAEVLVPAFREAVGAGFLTGIPERWELTPRGAEQWAVFAAGLKAWLGTQMNATTPEHEAALDAALTTLTDRLLDEETVAAVRSPMLVVAGQAL